MPEIPSKYDHLKLTPHLLMTLIWRASQEYIHSINLYVDNIERDLLASIKDVNGVQSK